MNNKLSETQVYISVKSYLLENKWQILGGQPPSGTDYLPVIEIRDPSFSGKGSKGSFKPDLIAWHNFLLMIIELKPTFSLSDREKVNGVLQSPERVTSLWESLIERNINLGVFGKIEDIQSQTQVVGGLGYGGKLVEHPEVWRFHVNDEKVCVTPGSFATGQN
jgi:hypothetical protein